MVLIWIQTVGGIEDPWDKMRRINTNTFSFGDSRSKTLALKEMVFITFILGYPNRLGNETPKNLDIMFVSDKIDTLVYLCDRIEINYKKLNRISNHQLTWSRPIFPLRSHSLVYTKNHLFTIGIVPILNKEL